MKRKFLIFPLVLLTVLLLVMPAFAAADGMAAPGNYVTDAAGILSDGERQALEQAAETVSEQHDFGVYLMTVEDFRAYTDSTDVFDGAVALYKACDLGLGEERRGVLLLLSMQARDYSLITYSDYGNFVFDQTTREGMTYDFLDNFRRNDWYGGFADYVIACDMALADGPARVRQEIGFGIGVIVLVPLIIAAIGTAILGRKMRTVARATRAEAYAGDGLALTNSYDRFTHATETRRRRKSESSHSGSRSRSSGGFGGTSGKF